MLNATVLNITVLASLSSALWQELGREDRELERRVYFVTRRPRSPRPRPTWSRSWLAAPTPAMGSCPPGVAWAAAA
jgi:hypothetical protein